MDVISALCLLMAHGSINLNLSRWFQYSSICRDHGTSFRFPSSSLSNQMVKPGGRFGQGRGCVSGYLWRVGQWYLFTRLFYVTFCIWGGISSSELSSGTGSWCRDAAWPSSAHPPIGTRADLTTFPPAPKESVVGPLYLWWLLPPSWPMVLLRLAEAEVGMALGLATVVGKVCERGKFLEWGLGWLLTSSGRLSLLSSLSCLCQVWRDNSPRDCCLWSSCM